MFPRILVDRISGLRRCLVFCGLFSACVLASDFAVSQGPRADSPRDRRNVREPRDLFTQLPAPPTEIGKLIKAGSVTLKSGPQSPGPEYDARLTGKTNYKIEYHYSSRSQWRIDRTRRQLIITVRYSNISWKPRHVIWLRDIPSTERTWSDRILLHEFDHVRISNDARMAKRFTELLKENPVIRYDLKPGENVTRGMVDRIVEEHVESVFQELADLIAIRYRELDRDTKHGARELLESSQLYPFLRGGGTVPTAASPAESPAEKAE